MMRRYTIRFVIPECDREGEEHRLTVQRSDKVQAETAAQCWANRMYPNNKGIDIKGLYEGKRTQ